MASRISARRSPSNDRTASAARATRDSALTETLFTRPSICALCNASYVADRLRGAARSVRLGRRGEDDPQLFDQRAHARDELRRFEHVRRALHAHGGIREALRAEIERAALDAMRRGAHDDAVLRFD